VLSRDKSGTLARLETDAESQEGISALADLHQRNPRLAATATPFLPSRTPPYFLSIFNLESIPRKSVLFNNRIGMEWTMPIRLLNNHCSRFFDNAANIVIELHVSWRFYMRSNF
jgi:hypothetical protein